MEDTPDKVSAESLAHVGRLVELGLRTNAFVGIEPFANQNQDEITNNTVEPSDEPEHQESRTLFIIATVGLTSTIGLLVLVEFKGKQ